VGLFERRTAGRLSSRTKLLLAADPGPALLDAARQYDPAVREWHGRLVFRNGVLLFGPVQITPKLEQEAGLPAGTAVAWYTGSALQPTKEERPHDSKVDDGDNLVRGLAERLGATVRYAGPDPTPALLASVYSQPGLAVERVIEVLRPYGGDLKAEDSDEISYGLTGKSAPFYVGYFGPRIYTERDAPPALGSIRPGPLHHWDINTGVNAKRAAHKLCLTVGEAALALARESGGVALDMLGFPLTRPEDLLPR
jgi:hypothetical protein